MRGSAGFTLLELLWTVLIACIVLALGVPSFRTLVLDSRRTADVNAFVLAVQLARSEAVKRGRPGVLCASTDGERCTSPKRALDAGWIVFVNEDDDRPPQRSPAESVLYAYRPASAGPITANRDSFEFWPYHRRRSTNGTVVFCDVRGAAAARAVVVSYTGRPRVEAASDDRALRCGAST